MSWRVLEFNDKPTAGQPRVFATNPGTRCSIRVAYETHWKYNSNDYCPDCVVQLCYGMESVFSQGVIESGIDNQRGYCCIGFTVLVSDF
jgi:hypothetical protein